jgi:histidine triad (HIT) family protein
MSTVFGKIIAGQLPAKKVFENERILAIEDIAPAAPVHILIMPKKEITSLHALKEEDLSLIAEIVQVAQ